MNDYSKWDKLQDSDEEEEVKAQARGPPVHTEDPEELRQDQELVERWLRKQVSLLNRSQTSGPARHDRPPELKELAPYRKVTKEEIKILSVLIVISHFEEGKTNLDRHPQMLDVARHHRWLEEDPGTLELLCRVHSQAMRRGPGGSAGSDAVPESAEDARIRNMCFSGINTLAAPAKAKCTGGILELITLICTPASDEARELRRKWQKKEFAKDAIFESLFPDLKGFSEERADSGMKDVWVILAVLVLIIIVILVVVFGPSLPAFMRMTDKTRPTPAPKPSPPPGVGSSEL